MSTLALNRNWDLRLEPDSVDSTAFSPIVEYPVSQKKTLKLTQGCDTIAQKIKQNILSEDILSISGDNYSREFISALVKSAIMSVEGVNSILEFCISERYSSSSVFSSVYFVVDTDCGIIRSR